VTRFFDLDEANAALPELQTILQTLRDERAELIRLRDRVLEHQAVDGEADEESPAEARSTTKVPSRSRTPSVEPPERGRAQHPADAEPEGDVRILRLRMQGVIDQMQAGVARIDELGVTLREIETGLIDFPALASGRQIWLCWRLGEGDIEWWHELGDGFGGRQTLLDLR
jgi:hypothetical protein